jgi:hypothetical protein
MVDIAEILGFYGVIVSLNHGIRLPLVIGRSGSSVYHFKMIM